MRILLIEDDELIGNAIQQALHDAAYAVDWMKNGHTALSTIQTQDYGVLLLDLGLPDKDGIQVLQAIRNTKNTIPIIIITARDAVEDRIKGLDCGADDYLVKPFLISELQARIRAVVRRNQGAADPILSNELLELNPVTHEVKVADETYLLSAREYALLYALMLRPGSILSRDELEDRLYGWNEEVASNAIEFIIHGLRKKIGREMIKNVRGLGWMVSK